MNKVHQQRMKKLRSEKDELEKQKNREIEDLRQLLEGKIILLENQIKEDQSQILSSDSKIIEMNQIIEMKQDVEE